MNEKFSQHTFNGCLFEQRSVTLRYSPDLLTNELERNDVESTSQSEGLRLIELEHYRHIRMFLLDESTLMKTGTYKSLDGCISTALCKKKGIQKAVFSSGANAGSALSDYGARSGMETFFFCPTTTLYKLNADLFSRPETHLIGVEGSDRVVKDAAALFSARTGIAQIPQIEWRLASAGYRAHFVAEAMRHLSHGFSWFTQSVCAGYGPIGFYRLLGKLISAGSIPGEWAPKFLGIQQAGLSPIVTAWNNHQSTLPPFTGDAWSESSIEPTLYNAYPSQTYPMLHDLLSTFGGNMMEVRHAEFDGYSETFAAMLQRVGIELTKLSFNGTSGYLEKAGLLAGAGTLKAIDEGRIPPSQTVLISLTGGAGPKPTRSVVPERWISAEKYQDQVESYATEILEKQSQRKI